ncbi:type ISP restriction/modification enzyme [Inquilinus sp. NPDC058860]|uniref:type ISP restriction/modification enzyme n=1 Tax=Inquilinus sp. NPDC058860 TaxID=3346652 RepID=UPI0036AB8232
MGNSVSRGGYSPSRRMGAQITISDLSKAVSAFGKRTTAKLSNPAISGAPEDQLRGPLEVLIADLALIAGHVPGAVGMVGETSLSEDRTRPDYAVTVRNALVGFIEVKAPGKGANPRAFRDKHDKAQWERLKSLPNLIYTDGNSFGLWRDGERFGDIVRLEGDVESSGEDLAAPMGLVALIGDFLSWQPVAPRSPKRLAEISARLCRLLREEVSEQLRKGNAGLTNLAQDWRKLLFPEANDESFADGYAQAVTFGLLIARARDIPLAGGIDQAANALRRSSSLIGTALRLLTDDVDNLMALETSLGTMARVFDAVNWPTLSKGDADAWLYFYEHFLEVYDNTLRKRTGSYYTPPEVVNAMVRLVDEALRSPLFNRPQGLASHDVTIADPAVGTGTFLLGVLRKIAQTVGDDLGPGSVPGALEAAAERLIGFELQFGPFAVAQLRLLAEYGELIEEAGARGDLPEPKLFITDTLGNPFVEDDYIHAIFQPIAQSRRAANRIKKNDKITVVIGNPPYKEKAEGRGGWIEDGSDGREAPMERWRPPAEWHVGAHAKHLKNLYVYFWRWASLKVFGAGWHDATGLADGDEEGIICFITVAGFLNGPGFQKMRADLRASCSDIWVIDCSPEGHQPEVATRIFQGVQQPVCIVLAARRRTKDTGTPGRVHFRALAEGRREEKFAALAEIGLGDAGWVDGPDDWAGPFLPEASGEWADFPALKSLFVYNGSGVMPGRTWVIAPDKESLARRWTRLTAEADAAEKERLFHPHLRNDQPGDKHIRKIVRSALANHPTPSRPILNEDGPLFEPTRYAFRSFDRQWIIPDARLINQPNPTLWEAFSGSQVYLTALDAHSPDAGPAVSFAGQIPDLHHYKGSFGGRVFPLWADADATRFNIVPAILAHLAETYGHDVSPPDLMAYLAAVMAHPAFIARFAKDLKQPGLHVPLTADAGLFVQAVALGREVIWLHTYGERFDDPAAGRPKQAPRLDKARAPVIPVGGAIPGTPEPLPGSIDYDPTTRRLTVGKGHIDNVMSEIWAYEVSGKPVVRQWFSYRKRDRSRPVIGDRRQPSPLDAIQPDHWLNEYTTDLMNLLHVLGRLVLLEPRQAELLEQILGHPLLGIADLGLGPDNDGESDKVGSDGST